MQSRILVECVKCGVSEGGVACGPVEGAVNSTVKYTRDGETKWLTNSEFTGIPNFYLTDEDVFDRLMDQNLDDEEFVALMEASHIEEFEGIKLYDNYDEIEEAIDKAEDLAATLLYY